MSATNRGSKRHMNDFYTTPKYTLESLLNVLKIPPESSLLEPCRGGGIIYNSVDCKTKEYCEIMEGKDYLSTNFKNKYDLIITNPPYSLAQEFVEKSLTEADSIWYLLRVNFLESLKRVDWWQDKLPTHLLTLSARPSFTGKGTDATAYAWYGWDKTGICTLKPGIHVLPYNKY